MFTKLNLISNIAKSNKTGKLSNLIHMLDENGLRECFYLLKKNKACGIDQISLEEYGYNLDENIRDLV